MKKTIIIFTLIFLLSLTGCQQIRDSVIDSGRASQDYADKESEDELEEVAAAFEPTPSPSSAATDEYSSWLLATYKTLSVQDGVLTMNIPTDLDQEYATAGSLNIISGRLYNPDNDPGICQITVTHFFQAEDLPMEFDSFDSMTEFNQFMNFGLDMDYERISDTTIDDHAQGFYTAYTFRRESTDYDCFVYYIASADVYYKISFLAPQGFVTADDVWTMFKSVKIDAEKESEWVEAFELKTDDLYYYSSRVEGAMMKHYGELSPAESIRMVFNDVILNLTLDSSNGFVFVHCYEYSIFSGDDSYEDFIYSMNVNLVERGLYDALHISDIERHYTDDGLLYLYYPEEYMPIDDLMIFEVLYMYDDAYYMAEIWYMGDDFDELVVLMCSALSFTAPGENITPIFEEYIE